MSATRRWHEDPTSGLLDEAPSAPVENAAIPHSDGGVRYFPDVSFPAHKEDLYRSAVAHGAPEAILAAIRALPEHVFGAARDVPDLNALAGLTSYEPDRRLPEPAPPPPERPPRNRKERRARMR